QRKIARQIADNDARLTDLRHDIARSILEIRRAQAVPFGTSGEGEPGAVTAGGPARGPSIDEVQRQVQNAMGPAAGRLRRERRESFVELNAYDNFGKTSYGTAGYLGQGYFITVKHGVVALDDDREGRERRITSVTIRYDGKELDAEVVDTGEATVEVH